jgi:hypothetical protein
MTTATWQLGGVEGRRMLRHPAYPIAMLYIVAFGVAVLVNDEGGPAANFTYIVLTLAFLLVYAPLTFVAANRVAAGTYRRRVRDVLAVSPVGDRQRTAGAMVGLLRGPVLVGLVPAAALLVVGNFATSATEDTSNAVYQRTALEYLQLPVLVLGAGLLGIAVARWLPWPGALPLTALVLWLGTIALYPYAPSGTVAPDGAWFLLWPAWFASTHGMLPRQPLGQEMWHLVYLLGLSVLAGVAALLRSEGPKRSLYATAGATVVLTALAAWLQLG